MADRQRAHLFMEYERWCYDAKGLGPATRKKYLLRARAADRWLQANRGVALFWAKPKDLQAYLWSTPPTARNRNNIRQAMVSFCAWLMESGFAQTNNATALPRLPEPTSLPKPIDPDSLRRLLAVADRWPAMDRALIFTYAFTGMRKTEVRTLEWTHFLPDVGSKGCWLSFTGKGGRQRVVPVHEAARERLSGWRGTSDSPQWVFPRQRGPQGGPVSDTYVKALIWRLGSEAGIPNVHPHRFRHSVATHLAEAGAPLEVVQELLGHADPKTTRIYLHVRPGKVKEWVDRLEDR